MNVRRWRAPLLWAAVILMVSSVPLPAVAAPEGTDKGIHGILYLVLGFLAARALLSARTARVWQLLVLVAVLVAFGGLDELHQRWIPGRTADVKDWAADTTGVVVGVVAGLFRGRRRTAPVL
ncbi:MAG TPA: VanZ family protein [Gemmatimonadaceae bacterium]